MTREKQKKNTHTHTHTHTYRFSVSVQDTYYSIVTQNAARLFTEDTRVLITPERSRAAPCIFFPSPFPFPSTRPGWKRVFCRLSWHSCFIGRKATSVDRPCNAPRSRKSSLSLSLSKPIPRFLWAPIVHANNQDPSYFYPSTMYRLPLVDDAALCIILYRVLRCFWYEREEDDWHVRKSVEDRVRYIYFPNLTFNNRE